MTDKKADRFILIDEQRDFLPMPTDDLGREQAVENMRQWARLAQQLEERGLLQRPRLFSLHITDEPDDCPPGLFNDDDTINVEVLLDSLKPDKFFLTGDQDKADTAQPEQVKADTAQPEQVNDAYAELLKQVRDADLITVAGEAFHPYHGYPTMVYPGSGNQLMYANNWTDGEGKPLPPFTVVTAAELRSGKIKIHPEAQFALEQALAYLDRLENAKPVYKGLNGDSERFDVGPEEPDECGFHLLKGDRHAEGETDSK